MKKIRDISKVRQMNAVTRHFIGESIAMLNLNFDNFEIEVLPKTGYAFRMIVFTPYAQEWEDFNAAEVKGTKGTFKVAKLIARIDKEEEKIKRLLNYIDHSIKEAEKGDYKTVSIGFPPIITDFLCDIVKEHCAAMGYRCTTETCFYIELNYKPHHPRICFSKD